jgi:cytochrome c556
MWTRTFTIALIVTAQQAVAAMPMSPSQRAQTFAQCSGRLAALAMYQDVISDERPVDVRVVQNDFDALLEATLPAAIDFGMPESVAAQAKFDAWTAQSDLINTARFSQDDLRATTAKRASDGFIASCLDLVMPRS